ncbi:MAG: DNA-directed RNA polymerase subunit A', partial [Haloarculaceae archaeon]
MSQHAPKEIHSLSFGLMDPEEYREMSATKVITADTYDDDGFPIDMGLMDPRLGVIDPGLECKTCGKHSGSCNGHFGHIELAAPVIHVGFNKLIRRLLRGTCRECSRLTPVDGSKYGDLQDASDDADEKLDEFRRNLRGARDLGQDVNDELKSAMRTCRRSSTDTRQERCPYCGEVQYDIKHEKPTTYYEVQRVLSSEYPELIAAAMEPDDPEDDRVTPNDLADETGIDVSRIQEILSGSFRPREEDRKAIESALDVDLTEEDMNKLMPSDIRDWFE